MYLTDSGVSDESACFKKSALLRASNNVWLGHDSGVIGYFIFTS